MSPGRARLRVVALGCAVALSAQAQPRPRQGPSIPRFTMPAPVTTAASEDPRDLRQRFGIEKAVQLLRSVDPADRLRGFERAAAVGGPEALAVLVQQTEAATLSKLDARAHIALARGLAANVDQPTARAALLLVLQAGTPRPTSTHAESDEPSFAARLEMSRAIAALALAQAADPRSIDALVTLAANDSVGPHATPGAAAALSALDAYPPRGSATWPRPITPGIAKLIEHTGDLRARGALLEAAHGGDAPTRAAAIATLGIFGDGRVAEIAKAALTDEDAHVRVAAASALIALGDPGAAHAVEALLADDLTAGEAIRLAERVHSPGIVKSLAARAAASPDVTVRAACIAALGRDPAPEAIEALSAFLADPLVRTDAAVALARSPSAAAMAAIEKLAAAPATQRLGARAYVVRASARGETSGALERLLRALASSNDPRDRGLGTQARAILQRVRPAPAPGERAATADLRTCVHAGGADALPCVFALARRSSEASPDDAAALLASTDALVRAHAARGLARSSDPSRGGRLVAAYAYEPDAGVRLALIESLPIAPLSRTALADALALAARLDPDARVRWTAARLASGAPPSPPEAGEVAWIHLADASSGPVSEGTTGALVYGDGVALPVVFDADGDALLPGVPVGDPATLILAPRLTR